jgi:putative ABC transport system permease protein
LPSINLLFKTQFTVNLFQQWQLPVFIVIVLVLVVLLAGSYPGLVLAGFTPVRALKGKLSVKDIGGFPLRRVLIVGQFAISQVLIIGMFIIGAQMRYSKTSDLGFSKEAILMLPVPVNDRTKMNTLRTRFEEEAGVERASLCFEAPASSANSFTSVHVDNRDKDEPFEINLKDADDQYLLTFGLRLVAGRNLFPSDTTKEFLVNETFVKKLGLKSSDDVIGKLLSINGGQLVGPVVGVVSDFHNNSLHEAIAPICIMINYNRFKYCAVKIGLQSQDVFNALAKIWNGIYPDQVFAYSFLDDRVAEFYEQDRMMLKLVRTFAIIAILIACLGLYGLVSFMTINKRKEIGIRNALGAGLHNIAWLFGKEFTYLLLIAFVIATPIAWIIMERWLQEFAYRITIRPTSFLLAVSSTFMAAALTVTYHSLKAALANPVDSLRSE